MTTTGKVKRRRKIKTPSSVRINLDSCKYDVLKRAAGALQWTVAGEDQAFHLLWSDCSVTSERVMKLVTGQVSNKILQSSPSWCREPGADGQQWCAENKPFLRHAGALSEEEHG